MQLNSSSSNTVSWYTCFYSGAGTFISISLTAVKGLLLLPLYILVFYFGFQRWRQQRSFQTTTHSDVFTYHMAAMALIIVVADVILFQGVFTGDSGLISAGTHVNGIGLTGEVFIHCLTCVERYLAVVHPITYMRLRQRGGVRIRNISTGCVWLLSFGFTGIVAYYYPAFPDIPYLCLLSACLLIISFCSLSVLIVLNRPGPGGGARARVDQSKQKAFHTIMAILGVLLLWFLAFLVCLLLTTKEVNLDECLIFVAVFSFNIPSSLVLPVIFLQRAGKLPCC